MSGNGERQEDKGISPKQVEREYEIGYGKPPKEYQFKPGESGNNRGRPKGSKNTKVLLTEALSKTHAVPEAGKSKNMNRLEIVISRLIMEAMKGNVGAMREVFKLMNQHGADDTPLRRGITVRFVDVPRNED